MFHVSSFRLSDRIFSSRIFARETSNIEFWRWNIIEIIEFKTARRVLWEFTNQNRLPLAIAFLTPWHVVAVS